MKNTNNDIFGDSLGATEDRLIEIYGDDVGRRRSPQNPPPSSRPQTPQQKNKHRDELRIRAKAGDLAAKAELAEEITTFKKNLERSRNQQKMEMVMKALKGDKSAKFWIRHIMNTQRGSRTFFETAAKQMNTTLEDLLS